MLWTFDISIITTVDVTENCKYHFYQCVIQFYIPLSIVCSYILYVDSNKTKTLQQFICFIKLEGENALKII
jgi:uncharacterized protein YrzB (UPF0473 family)